MLYAVLHNSLVGQRLNLTSSSFRAFRFAKRCPGSRGRLPFRSVGADDLGGPNPRPPSIEKRTDSHVAPLLGMTENGCHCEEARRADAAIRIPHPPQGKAPLCKGSWHGAAVTEGLSGVAGPFWGDLCRDSHPFLRIRAADAPLCAAGLGG